MTYLITGGSGLVGSFLLDLLAADVSIDKRDIHVIYRSSQNREKIEEFGFIPVKADLTDKKSLEDDIRELNADIEELQKQIDDHECPITGDPELPANAKLNGIKTIQTIDGVEIIKNYAIDE